MESFHQGESFSRWLRGFVRNKALESHRAARGRRAIVDSRILDGMEDVYRLFDAPPGQEHWQERLQQLLRHCIDRLSPHSKDAIVRVYSEGLSLRGGCGP